LKCVLFDFHEILECRFEKAQKDRENRKREIEIDSPEYLKKMEEIFQKSQEAIRNGKVNEMDASRFNGDPEKGKKTFEAIVNSFTAEEKENFHFWPQMSEEEKAEKSRKDISRTGEHPVLRSKKIHAINEITQALDQEPKIKNNDLSPENQN
jgi:hypothetical protein